MGTRKRELQKKVHRAEQMVARHITAIKRGTTLLDKWQRRLRSANAALQREIEAKPDTASKMPRREIQLEN